MGFPLPLNKALKWGQEAWILGLSQLDFVEEGHVQSGQVEGSFVVLLRALLLRRATRQVTGILGYPSLCVRSMHAVQELGLGMVGAPLQGGGTLLVLPNR